MNALHRGLLGLAGFLLSLAPPLPSLAGPEELVAAERSFAAAVVAQGEKPAFLQHLDADGMLFRPQPVRAADYFASAPPEEGLLEWAPAYVRLARSGDLGFTTGPWAHRAARTNLSPQAHGQYLTVWRRTPAGWKAALDAGIGSPPQPFPDRARTDGPEEADEPLPAWQQTQRGRDLKFVEESFGARSARQGEAVALEAHGHRRVLVLRQGALPVTGRAEATRFLSANRLRTRDALHGLQVSAAGDLGYAWGESELLGSGPTPARTVRSWVRVWRRSGWSGTWRVALDLAIDYPSPP